MNNVRAVLLVHSRWIYIIYEELIQTRKFANMCVLLFVRCLFVYLLTLQSACVVAALLIATWS